MAELGIETSHAENKLLEVWNKIDLLADDRKQEIHNAAARSKGKAICMSATTGEGLPEVLTAIEERLNSAGTILDITLQPGEGALMNWLHENAQMLGQSTDNDGQTTCRIRISAQKRLQLTKQFSNRPRTLAAE